MTRARANIGAWWIKRARAISPPRDRVKPSTSPRTFHFRCVIRARALAARSTILTIKIKKRRNEIERGESLIPPLPSPSPADFRTRCAIEISDGWMILARENRNRGRMIIASFGAVLRQQHARKKSLAECPSGEIVSFALLSLACRSVNLTNCRRPWPTGISTGI